MSALCLTGFSHSVYTRSVRIALGEKAVPYEYVEHNPFDLALVSRSVCDHPFARVPVLKDGGFRLYETLAILTYVNESCTGPDLMPQGAKTRARALQVLSIADSYVYQPLVRMAFSHGVYRPTMGEVADDELVQQGLEVAPRALGALEEIAVEGLVLRADHAPTTEGHLFAMLDYFVMLEQGRKMLTAYPALARWFASMAERDTVRDTKPDLGVL